MATPLSDRLVALTPVTLAELDAAAALQVRRDRKYLVTMDVARTLVEQLGDAARVLQIDGRRTFRYASLYYDTPRLDSFLGAARGRPHRFKVRTRRYLDGGGTVLELKTRDGRGRTVKQRRARDPGSDHALRPAELAFLEQAPEIGRKVTDLEPVLANGYRRATLLLDGGSRLTIDTGLVARLADGTGIRLVDTAVVETKSAGAASRADRLLWSLGTRPLRISKFATSLVVLQPGLPGNRWTRAIHHAWHPADGGRELPAWAGGTAAVDGDPVRLAAG